jgi:protein-S-isoprenylcysteine O-methyltransferase Ste14
MKDERDNAGIRFPPPLIYLGLLLIGLAAERAIDLRSFGVARPLLLAAGLLLILAGAAAIVAAAGLFRRAGITPEPWTSTTSIVTTGIYRRTRNPMYLGMALIYAGLAFALDAPLALILLPVALVMIQTQVIAREERYLEAKFGEPYRDYSRRVRRWL